MGILWTIVIGFVAGIIAKFIHPGPNEPSGFILTTILGIVGAFVATFLGQALGWYRPDQGRPDRCRDRRSYRAVHLEHSRSAQHVLYLTRSPMLNGPVWHATNPGRS